MRKLTAAALLIFGIPIWWWMYWKIDSMMPINVDDYLLHPGYQHPPGSFDALLLQAQQTGNRRLYKVLTKLSPITLHRPGAKVIVKTVGDLAPYHQSVPSTSDGRAALFRYAIDTHDAALRGLLDNFTVIGLRGYFAGGDGYISVPGDIWTRFDWSATSDQKVLLYDGLHAILRPADLQELIRRRQALISAGVAEAPAPTKTEIQEDMELEASYPPQLQLEQPMPVYPSLQAVGAQNQLTVLPTGTFVTAYEVSPNGRRCHVRNNASQVFGWIDLPPGGCELNGRPARRPVKTSGLPANWISNKDLRQLESRSAKIQQAVAHPVDPAVITSLAWCEWYARPFAVVFILWFMIDLAINRSKTIGGESNVMGKDGYLEPYSGIPHGDFKWTNEERGEFSLALPNSSGLQGGTYFGCMTIVVAGILYMIWGISTGFLVILTLGFALAYFCARLEPTRIARRRDLVLVDGTPLRPGDELKFSTGPRGGGSFGLKLQYGNQTFDIGGEWSEQKAVEIASSLNRLMKKKAASYPGIPLPPRD